MYVVWKRYPWTDQWVWVGEFEDMADANAVIERQRRRDRAHFEVRVEEQPPKVTAPAKQEAWPLSRKDAHRHRRDVRHHRAGDPITPRQGPPS